MKPLVLVFALLVTGCPRCAGRPTAPEVVGDGGLASSVVGAGTPVWFENDPAVPELNTRVDLGTVRAINDELEVGLEWPMSLGLKLAIEANDPGLEVPAGSRLFATERVVCSKRGALHFETQSRLVGPDGGVLRIKEADSKSARTAAEQTFTSSSPGSYGRDPRSLVCWAVARKCAGQPVSWPPPPNLTPLEYSERADRMRAEYNASFIPRCGARFGHQQ
jgi:hypothetical protein